MIDTDKVMKLLIWNPFSLLTALAVAIGVTGASKPPVEPPPVEEAPQMKKSGKKTKRWTLQGGTPEENEVLDYFQTKGITDRAALAVLLGNIKQESKFDVRVCEGGKRTGYWGCHSGGFGLIQWTTEGRYQGLGRYAQANGCDPNSLQCQLDYLMSEVEWTKVQSGFMSDNNSIDGYMRLAKRWLGWGVHGARTTYSYEYYDLLR